MKRLVAVAALLLTFGVAEAAELWKTGGTFNCTVDNIGATLTEMTGCAVPAQANLRYYITSIVAQSTTSTAGQWVIRSGTGTNCGTGTTNLMGTATARFAAPANTAGGASLLFDPPLAASAGHALCLLGVATNTTTAIVSGYLAP